MTPRKHATCMTSLMGYMTSKNQTPEAVRAYVLRQLNNKLTRKGITAERLAEATLLEEHCEPGETPAAYLTAILSGKRPLIYEALDQITCATEIKPVTLFPFRRGAKNKPVAAAEVLLLPGEARTTSQSKEAAAA